MRRVDPFELEHLNDTVSGADRTHAIYVAVAKDRHMVRRRAPSEPAPSLVSAGSFGDFQSLDAGDLSSPRTVAPSSPSKSRELAMAAAAAGSSFDSAHYREQPEMYVPIFHTVVLPHASVIVNCMYWDSRFPRLVSCKQARELSAAGRLRLLGVCDISCDLKGSIELLREFTSIEEPFYIFDVRTGTVVRDLAAPGVLFHAVDHLPSECPKDASSHFGSCLLPLLPHLLRAPEEGTAPVPSLPAEVAGAIICAEGALTPNFDYIAALRASASRAENARSHRRSHLERSLSVQLVGHLFDTNIMGKVLDIIEDSGSASARIAHCSVGKDRTTPTRMLLQIIVPGAGCGGATTSNACSPSPPFSLSLAYRDPTGTKLAAILESVAALVGSVGVDMVVEPPSEDDAAVAVEGGTLRPVLIAPPSSGLACAADILPLQLAMPLRRILVLGAGYVSSPLVEYLLRRPDNQVTVTSVALAEATRLAAGRPRCVPLQLDVMSEDEALGALVASHDLVVSLVPAPCHPAVARHAIAHRRNMVTASYVSPEMSALHDAAAAAGIVILNEAGLDPGIDHMSAMALMDGARSRGGVITSFSSGESQGSCPRDSIIASPQVKARSSSLPRSVRRAAGARGCEQPLGLQVFLVSSWGTRRNAQRRFLPCRWCCGKRAGLGLADCRTTLVS